MTTILEAFGISCLTVAMLGAAIFILMSFCLNLFDSSFKRIITGAFLIDWMKSMWDMFTIKGCIILIMFCGLVFTIPVMDSMKKIELEEQGKHTCTCKVCQKTMLETRYGEAAVKYLGLDEKDIDELLSSSTNKIIATEVKL